MFMYLHIHTYVCDVWRLEASRQIRLCICVCACVCVHMYVCIYSCIYIYIHTCVACGDWKRHIQCDYVYVCVCICMHMYVCIYINTKIYKYVCVCTRHTHTRAKAKEQRLEASWRAPANICISDTNSSFLLAITNSVCIRARTRS